MGISVKFKVKHHFKRLDRISNKLMESTAEGIEEVIKNIRGYAIKLERRSQRARYSLRDGGNVDERSKAGEYSLILVNL